MSEQRPELERRWARDRMIDRAITPVVMFVLAMVVVWVVAPGLLDEAFSGMSQPAATAIRVVCALALVFAVTFWGVRGRQRRLEVLGLPTPPLSQRVLLWVSVATGFACLVALVLLPVDNAPIIVALALAAFGVMRTTRAPSKH